MFCDYFMLVTLNKIGEADFRLLGTNGFHVKAKNKRSTAAGSRLSSEPQTRFHIVTWQTSSKNCTKKLAARAA